jgi:hypothetical protein
MTILIDQKYTSLKTGNTLKVTATSGRLLMIESSDGSESGHARKAFEACVESGDYVLQKLTPTELVQQIDAVYAVPLKKGFRIEAALENGTRIVLKNTSTNKPAAVQLYEGVANWNSSKNSIGRHFTFSNTVDKSGNGGNLGWGGNHLRSFPVL